MAKTVCKAVKRGIVPKRGRPSIEWYKDGVPQYYCYGYYDKMTDEILDVCKNCVDHVDHTEAEKDYEEYWKGRRQNEAEAAMKGAEHAGDTGNNNDHG